MANRRIDNRNRDKGTIDAKIKMPSGVNPDDLAYVLRLDKLEKFCLSLYGYFWDWTTIIQRFGGQNVRSAENLLQKKPHEITSPGLRRICKIVSREKETGVILSDIYKSLGPAY